jgi:hypothetical protein
MKHPFPGWKWELKGQINELLADYLRIEAELSGR